MERIGVQSEAWKLAQLSRHIPEILDPQSANGGVMRLLRNAGGAVVSRKQGRIRAIRAPTIVEHEDGSSEQLDPGSIEHELGELEGTGAHLPLLIRHETESPAQFAFRSAIAAPRGTYWAAVDTMAARPWSKGIRYTEETVIPSDLELESELMMNVNCSASDPRSLLAFILDVSRDSNGLGLAYVMIDWSPEAGRWFLREIPARYVPSTAEDKLGMKWIEFSLTPKIGPNGERYRRVQRYVRAGEPLPLLKKTMATASHVILRARASGPVQRGDLTDEQLWEVEPQEYGGRQVLWVEMAPHQAIPIVPIPTGRINPQIRGAHYVQPPILDAAKLDHLLLQMASNVDFATLVANTFMRFAKGLNPEDIQDWQEIGTRLFYATTSQEADMKWITLPAEALKAGMDLQTAIVRSIEVAGLAPMLTRATINEERATGQAIAAERSGVVGEGYALRAFSQWSRVVTFIRDAQLRQPLSTNGFGRGGAAAVRLFGHSDFGIQNLAEAKLLAQIYLDPKSDLPSSHFWAEMHRHGVITEEIDPDRLELARDPEARRREHELLMQRLKTLETLPQNGFMVSSKEQRQRYLNALREAGVLALSEEEARQFAEQDEAAGLLIRGNLQTLRTAQNGEI